MLSITQFQKKYPGSDAPVLHIPSIELNPGIYWIKGENGCGKTSLLKAIAGLLPFTGNIAVNGMELHNNRMAYTKAVNYAEAEPIYPPFLTGKELLDFYASTKGKLLPTGLMEGMGIQQFIQKKTALYSSGMLKKLSLALAFTGHPQLILLDEPLIALDAAAVLMLQKTIAAYHQQSVSFIITSHQALNSDIIPFTSTYSILHKSLVPA